MLKKTIDESNNQNKFDIIVSNKDNIYKIEISDYISIKEYINKKKSSNEFKILDYICNSILWDCDRQKVSKGMYYVIIDNKRVYNILFTDKEIMIDERIKKEIDNETKNKNIIQEKLITYYINENNYNYFSAKHDSNNSTYCTKYYDKNVDYSFLSLTKQEAYDEINLVIRNLESIKEIETILNIELLKKNILDDLSKNSLKKK